MEATCANCAYRKECRKDKTKICSAFIFDRKVLETPVVVKTNRVKRG